MFTDGIVQGGGASKEDKIEEEEEQVQMEAQQSENRISKPDRASVSQLRVEDRLRPATGDPRQARSAIRTIESGK